MNDARMVKRPEPPDLRILEEAAEWLMQLSEGACNEDCDAFERWGQRSPAHAVAWARAHSLLNKLGCLPPALAMPALDRTSKARRRAVIVRLAATLALAPAGWATWRAIDAQQWSADYRTAVGQQRVLRLADGSGITLNTASAVDVHFSAAQRVIRLRAGEILVETAHEKAATYRPFSVRTPQGRMDALGTRFCVRHDGDTTHLVVLDGAVRITPANARAAAGQVLHAGQKVAFMADAIDKVGMADQDVIAWASGMLVADKMRLDDFATELARYRSGIVQVDPAVARIGVSGAFPIGDTDRALAMLAATYAVDVRTRLRGRWISLVARSGAGTKNS